MQENTIYSIKLSTGEELVCKVLSKTGDYFEISEPASIIPTSAGIQFAPLMYSVDKHEPFKINPAHIVVIGIPVEPIKQKYIEAVTGLKLPNKQIILG